MITTVHLRLEMTKICWIICKNRLVTFLKESTFFSKINKNIIITFHHQEQHPKIIITFSTGVAIQYLQQQISSGMVKMEVNNHHFFHDQLYRMEEAALLFN